MPYISVHLYEGGLLEHINVNSQALSGISFIKTIIFAFTVIQNQVHYIPSICVQEAAYIEFEFSFSTDWNITRNYKTESNKTLLREGLIWRARLEMKTKISFYTGFFVLKSPSLVIRSLYKETQHNNSVWK